jgi:hypothetical protein
MADIVSPLEILVAAFQEGRKQMAAYYALPWWKRMFTNPPAMSVTRLW